MSRVAMFLFVAVRLIQLIEGAIAVSTGLDAYHPASVAVATLVLMTGFSVWIARADLRAGAHLPRIALFDATTSLVGIVVLGAATLGPDRTTSLNWMLPYSVGACVGLAISTPNLRGGILTALLSAVYVMTTWDQIVSGNGPAATAFANTASYIGFFLVIALTMRFIKRLGDAVDAAQRDSLATGQQLAAEMERRRHQRLIHDSVLQTLEAMGAGMAGDDLAMRRLARAEAAQLRQLLEDHPTSGGIRSGVARLTSETIICSALRVEVVTPKSLPEPSPLVTAALLGATREALVNSAKHSQVGVAVVRIRASEGGVELVVRDEGKGFDMATTGAGFGTRHSIQGRLAEIGGCATISSRPGEGTRVRIWGPVG